MFSIFVDFKALRILEDGLKGNTMFTLEIFLIPDGAKTDENVERVRELITNDLTLSIRKINWICLVYPKKESQVVYLQAT